MARLVLPVGVHDIVKVSSFDLLDIFLDECVGIFPVLRKHNDNMSEVNGIWRHIGVVPLKDEFFVFFGLDVQELGFTH